MPEGDSKVCEVCGRSFQWRKKWENNWHEVRYCSNQCRRRGRKPIDDTLENTILDLCKKRGPQKTICPSEAAKAAAPGSDESEWRDLMEPARMAARRLAHQGRIDITQNNKPADPDRAKGTVRLRIKR
jgi:hypothetical protein